MNFSRLTPLICSQLLLFAGTAHGQSSPKSPRPSLTEKSKTASSSDEKSNWLFILETQTQWLLLIQNDTGATGDNISSEGSPLEVGAGTLTASPGLSGSSNAGLTPTLLGKGSAGSPTSFSGKVSDDDIQQAKKTIFTFSGNTRDIPLQPESPGNPPSAPVS